MTSIQGSLLDEANWIQQLLLGSLASAIAVLAVAAIGAAMLTGRMELRQGARVIVGCFLLFGAPVIAAGLRDALGGASTNVVIEAPLPAPPTATPRIQPPEKAYDPYSTAGFVSGR